MEALGIGVIIFLVLLILGVPVGYGMGIITITYFALGDLPHWGVLPQHFFSGIDNFVIMAIPFFVFMGEIMNTGGITRDLIKFVNFFVGRIRGGLAYVNVFTSMLFAGITGSALSDTAALGSVLIPAMKEEGYDEEFSGAVTAATSIQGPIIPPSIPAVLVAGVARTSVGGVFVGGIIPGVLLGLSAAVIVFLRAKQRNYPKYEVEVSLFELLISFKSAFLAMLTPIIVIGGIISGFFTPTEAAVVASLYACVITFIIRRESIKELANTIPAVILITAKIYYLIAISNILGWILARENVPELVFNNLLALTTNRVLLLLIILAFLLFVGMWMDAAPAIVILTPILLPIMGDLGIHPIHFCVIFVVVKMVGLLTPPFGLVLFTVVGITNLEVQDLVKELWPFYIAYTFVMLITVFYSDLIMFFPRLFELGV